MMNTSDAGNPLTFSPALPAAEQNQYKLVSTSVYELMYLQNYECHSHHP